MKPKQKVREADTPTLTPDVTLCLRVMPKKLKIGAYDWTVILQPGDGDGKEALCGQAHFDIQQLWLFPKHLTGPDHVVGIVLHECLHVIFDNHGLSQMKRKKDDREEQIILGFEAGLISLFRDNPRLLTWMKKWLKAP